MRQTKLFCDKCGEEVKSLSTYTVKCNTKSWVNISKDFCPDCESVMNLSDMSKENYEKWLKEKGKTITPTPTLEDFIMDILNDRIVDLVAYEVKEYVRD